MQVPLLPAVAVGAATDHRPRPEVTEVQASLLWLMDNDSGSGDIHGPLSCL